MKIVIALYAATSIAVIMWMSAILFGGRIEAAVRPVLTNAHVGTVTRTADKACWSWDAVKMRTAMITDIDVVIENDGDLSFPEVKDRVTGRAWHTSGAKPPGPIHHDVCVDVPTTIEPSTPFILHTHVHYQGFSSWWEVVVDLPDVVVRGVSP